MFALVNSRLFLNGSSETHSKKAVVVHNSTIVAIVDEDTLSNEWPDCTDIVDLNGSYLAPGLIDLQVYGADGHLFGGSPSAAAIEAMEKAFAAQGTTGFLAAMATNSTEVLRQGAREAQLFRAAFPSIGSFWGIHLEGPFLNPIRRGAHPEELIQLASAESVASLLADTHGVVKMMTVAPELVGPAALSAMREAGVVLSAGHSDATYDQAVEAFAARSITACTHLFNAMPPMHHRDPGLVAAVFEQRPFASIVADGIHVNFAMVRLAKQLLGERLFLITDAVTSTLEGVYPHVFQGDRYVMPDGTLSGSALTMLRAVQNCVTHCGIPLAEAVRMASAYPAEVIGVGGQKGRIQEGYDADFVVFDGDYCVQRTFILGKCVFKKDGAF